MKKILLIALLIIGCANQKFSQINILDGKISTGSTTIKTDDIKKERKIECKELTVSSNNWCDCMNECSHDILNKMSFGNLDMRIYIEECPVNPPKKTN